MSEKRTTIVIVAKDLASGNIARVQKELGRLGTGGKVAALGMGGVGLAGNKLEQGLGHLKSTIGGLISGPLGILGLGGGILGVAGIMESSLSKTQDFAVSLEKLTALTGESAQSMGSLIIVADKYGVSADRLAVIAGFAEKTLGNLSNTTGKHAKGLNNLVKLQDQYGVSLATSTGQALPFSQVLSNVADYYTSNASAADKAALAAKVFGRGYADMIPILQLGSKGIRDSQQAVADLGLSLGTDSMTALEAYKSSIRSLGDALNVLQIEVGLTLAPMITKLANGITQFLEHGGAKQITTFFQQAADNAQKFGEFLTGSVIPAVQQVGSGLLGFWNGIPPDLRDLLVKGFVADRALKFAFGMSPVSGVTDLLGKGLGAVLGKVFPSLGVKAAVVNVSGGVVNGGGGGGLPGGAAAESGGLASLLTGAVPLVVGAAAPVVISQLLQYQSQFNKPVQGYDTAAGHLNGTGVGGVDYFQGLIPGFTGLAQQAGATSTGPDAKAVAVDLSKATRDLGYEVDNAVGQAWQAAAARIVKPLDALHQDLLKQLGVLKSSQDPKRLAEAAARLAGDAIKGAGNASNTQKWIDLLKKDRGIALSAGDHAALVRIDDAIRTLEGKLPGRVWAEQQLAAAQREAASADSQKQKLDTLASIQRDLLSHGDRAAASEVAKLADIASKKFAVQLNWKNTVQVSLSARSAAAAINRVTTTGGHSLVSGNNGSPIAL